MQLHAALWALAAGAAGAAAIGADVAAYEAFTPRVLSETFHDATSAKYASAVAVSVPFRGAEYVLDLEINRDLFAPDWALEEYGPEGDLLRRVNDTAEFMCHYTGSVRGSAGSYVTMSICDELGMTGHIHTNATDIEVQHASPEHAVGPRAVTDGHVAFDLKDLRLDGWRFGECATNDTDVPPPPPNTTVQPRMRRYTNSVAIASDSHRMRAFSSSSREAQNTQTVMNNANSPYSRTTWGSGNTLRHRVRTQAQNVRGWTHSSSISTKLRNLVSYRRNHQSRADNVQGLTHFNYGGTIGVAYIAAMCGSNSVGVNNVGYSSSNTARGQLVAHEMGHNYAFEHDSRSQGGSGFVMWPSASGSSPSRFSSYSVSRWNRYRSRFSCL